MNRRPDFSDCIIFGSMFAHDFSWHLNGLAIDTCRGRYAHTHILHQFQELHFDPVRCHNIMGVKPTNVIIVFMLFPQKLASGYIFREQKNFWHLHFTFSSIRCD